MKEWQRLLFFKSRDRFFLLKAALAIVLVGMVIGVVLNRAMPGLNRPANETISLELRPGIGLGDILLQHFLQKKDADFAEILEILPSLAEQNFAPNTLSSLLTKSYLSEENRRVAILLYANLLTREPEPNGAFQVLLDEEPPQRFAYYALGLFWIDREQTAKAAAAFEREGTFSDAERARKRALSLALGLQDLEMLQRLRATEGYEDLFNPRTEMRVAIIKGEWLRVFGLIAASQYHQVNFWLVLLSAWSGLIWFVILLQSSQPNDHWRSRLLLAGMSLLAGILSVIPTLFVVIYSEEALGFRLSQDLLGGLVYFIAGVGLREEAIKLLCFLPLVPLLLKRGNELEVLFLASIVGLGFAVEENVQYFHGSPSAVAPARFLTANFFHIAATGLCGLSFFRMFRNKRSGVSDFIATFIMLVTLHGAYDSFLALEALAEYRLFGMTAFIILCLMYFRELRQLRTPQRETMSLVGSFAIGLALLVAASLIYLVAQQGLAIGLNLLVPALLELGIIIYMFLREFAGT